MPSGCCRVNNNVRGRWQVRIENYVISSLSCFFSASISDKSCRGEFEFGRPMAEWMDVFCRHPASYLRIDTRCRCVVVQTDVSSDTESTTVAAKATGSSTVARTSFRRGLFSRIVLCTNLQRETKGACVLPSSCITREDRCVCARCRCVIEQVGASWDTESTTVAAKATAMVPITMTRYWAQLPGCDVFFYFCIRRLGSSTVARERS